MPLYDYICECGNEFEAFRSMAHCAEAVACPECHLKAPRNYAPPRGRSYLDNPEPLLVWRKPDGTYSLPANRDARKPAEYIAETLITTADKRRVEKSIARDHEEQWLRSQIGKEMLNEQITATNRSELRQRMQRMSAAQRDFARFAMQQNNDKPRPRYTGAFFFETLERDASNREEYRGPDGRGRGRK